MIGGEIEERAGKKHGKEKGSQPLHSSAFSNGFMLIVSDFA